MNNIILFILCFILFAFEYYSRKCDLLDPAVLLSGGFTVSSFIFALTNNTWNYIISDNTVIWIVLSIISFNWGSRFMKGIRIKEISQRFYTIKEYSCSTFLFIILLSIELLYIVLRYYSIVSVVGSFSFSENALKIYNIESKGNVAFGLPLKILSAIVSIIGVFAAVLIVNEFKSKNKRVFKPLILLMLYLLSTILSSARIEIIYTMIYLAVFALLSFASEHKYKISIKTMIISIIGIILLGRVFFSLGYLTGKSQIQVNIFDNLAIYGGSSIGAFDHYLKRMVETTDNLFTLSAKGVYTLLSYFGIHINRTATDTIGFVQLGNMQHTTNVYTGLMVVFHDFGYFGALIIMFLQGAFYQYLYRRAKMPKETVLSVWSLIYVYIAPFIILTSITDRFFTQIFTISSIVSYIAISIIIRSLNMWKGD